MARANTVLLNVSGGELSGEMYGRLDLPVYQRGNQRVQNYIVLPQGGLNYRNAFAHVHNTRSLNTGRIISFSFSEADTYVIEFTDKKLRFYRNFGAILNTASATISAITQAASVTITATAHGFSNDQEAYISGIKGMIELNNQFFIVKNVTANTFQIANLYGTLINSTSFTAYVSGGTASTVYEINSPYASAHIPELHYRQSADTLYITHQKYAPFKLTRTGHTNWTIVTFTRTNDPFAQKAITAITQANPGVFTATGHALVVNDEVFIADVVGMVEVNNNRYLVNTVIDANTFTLKDSAGTPLNTTGFTAYVSGGIVIKTKKCPKTVAFLDSARLVYANIEERPAGLYFSRAPDSTTGDTRFDDFTTGTDATHAVLYTLGPVFDKQDAIQWVSITNRQVIAGCASSVRRIHGNTINDPISPSSINAKPINNIGSSSVQAFSSGQSMFYVDAAGNRLQSFLFALQSDDFVTANQNLISNHLGDSNFIEVAQQRSDSGLLWVLRADGVLLGMTFNELESIFGWHRHYIGGSSIVSNVAQTRAKVLSIAVEPRSGKEPVLWALIERKVGSNTYRSVEYLSSPVRFVELEDFLTTQGSAAQTSDINKYINATYEQLKDSKHVDSAISYDGSAVTTTVNLIISATSGNPVVITASAAFFDSSHVGRQIWKEYDTRGNGGGRAEILSVMSPTQVSVKVLSNFDNTNIINAGDWYLTVNKVYGLLHLVGEKVLAQTDGAPAGEFTVASNGSITLSADSSKVHVGFKYIGIAMSLNLDIGGERGSAQAKIRKLRELIPRFKNTVGAKLGSTIWNVEPVTFEGLEDLTDRSTPVLNGIVFHRPSDSWTRQTKQSVLIQDIPSPQTLLSMDILAETADD